MSFTFRAVDPVADAPVLHSWVSQEYARFWGMVSATEQDVVEEYSKIAASGHHHDLSATVFCFSCHLTDAYQRMG